MPFDMPFTTLTK